MNGGGSWAEVTPPDLIEWSRVGCIEVSRHHAGSAYLAASRHKLDDFSGYIYKTEDFGESWRVLSSSFPVGEIARVIREDPTQPGLLYVGTESGICVSLDDGANWTMMKTNLPVVPVYDLKVKDYDLVAGTHGRSFWILDDLTPLRDLAAGDVEAVPRLFRPTPTYRRWLHWLAKDPRLVEPDSKSYLLTLGGNVAWREENSPDGELIRTFIDAGENPPHGAIVYYHLDKEPAEPVELSFLDSDGKLIKSFTSRPGEDEGGDKDDTDEEEEEKPVRFAPAKKGLNRFIWDMHYEDATQSTEDSPLRDKYEPLIRPQPETNGPLAVPGTYQVRLTVGDSVQTESFQILPDPRLEVTQNDFVAQFELWTSVRDKLSQTNAAIDRLRRIQRQTLEASKRASKAKSIDDGEREAITSAARDLNRQLESIEAEFTQFLYEGPTDWLRMPVKLDNHLGGLINGISMGDAAPTTAMYEIFDQVSGLVDEQLSRLQVVIDKDVREFNERVSRTQLPAIST